MFRRAADRGRTQAGCGPFYDLESVEHAHLFRSQPDHRLCDRFHDPAAWDVDARGKEHAA